MGGKRRWAALLAIAAASLALSAEALAQTPPGPIDLSTDAAVRSYLASIGVDPTNVLIQRGLNNYAGPSCPGAGWNCTTSTQVVQVAQAGGQNKFVCDPAYPDGTVPDPDLGLPPTDPLTDTCVIVQGAPDHGQNHARCFERSTMPAAVLTCIVHQTNSTGSNFAQIHQQIDQNYGPAQNGQERTDLRQLNGVGDNHGHVHQSIKQFTSEVLPGATPSQDQDGTFDARFEQRTIGGNNYGELKQFLTQDGRSSGGPTVHQRQFGDGEGDADQSTVFFGGEGSVTLSQDSLLGTSRFHAHQSENQNLIGTGEQTQIGPYDCCADQVPSSPNSQVNILQESRQHASEEDARQFLQLRGQFFTPGTGTITHHARNDEDSISTSITGDGLRTLVTTCASTEVTEPPEEVELPGPSKPGECMSTQPVFTE